MDTFADATMDTRAFVVEDALRFAMPTHRPDNKRSASTYTQGRRRPTMRGERVVNQSKILTPSPCLFLFLFDNDSNGGQCIEGMDQFGNDQFICDCNPTFDENTMTMYVGPTCDILVETSNYCDQANPDRNHFCVNDGVCRNGEDDFDINPCECQGGTRGKHCEFGNHIKCDLKCGQNGVCRNGKRPIQSMGATDKIHFGTQDTGANEMMYCECNEGFAGSLCEYEYVTCGDFQHYCFHGAVCQEVVDQWTCLCEINGVPGK